jgi:hypothetical protein
MNPLAAFVRAGLCAAAALAVQVGHAEPPYTNAADNKIVGQQLLNEVAARHPELLVIGFHAKLPGAANSTVFASNLNRVGKKDDDDDVAAAREAKTICGPRLDNPNKYEVEMPLRDQAGKVIGALSLIYPFHPGGDEVALFARSTAVRDALARKIPSLAALLVPVP